MVREGRHPKVVIDRYPVTTEPTAAAEEFAGTIGPYCFPAQSRSSLLAGGTTPATGHKGEDHVIPNADVIGPRFNDHTCTLVPEGHRQRPTSRPVHHRQVGVAHPCRVNPHKQLTRLGTLEIEVGNLQRSARYIGGRCTAHGEHRASDSHGEPSLFTWPRAASSASASPICCVPLRRPFLAMRSSATAD